MPRTRRGRTPLYNFAATGGSDIEIAQDAAGRRSRSETSRMRIGETALNYAADTPGTSNWVKLLIAAHADVNHRKVNGWSALLSASQSFIATMNLQNC